MAESTFREGLARLRRRDVGRPCADYVVSYAGTVMAPIAMAFDVLWCTALQHKLPEEMLSRVSAYDHLGSIALAPLGIVAAAFLYQGIGGRATLMLGLAIGVVATALTLCVRDVQTRTLGARTAA